MAGHITNPATKFEDPMTIRSWVTSSHCLLLKKGTRPLRMRRISGGDTGGVGGSKDRPLSWVGVTYKAMTLQFWRHVDVTFSALYTGYGWRETVVVDQDLLWFRSTLILSRISDYNIIFS